MISIKKENISCYSFWYFQFHRTHKKYRWRTEKVEKWYPEPSAEVVTALVDLAMVHTKPKLDRFV